MTSFYCGTNTKFDTTNKLLGKGAPVPSVMEFLV